MTTRIAQLTALIDGLVDAQSDTVRFVGAHAPDVVVVNLAGRRVLGGDELATAMEAGLATELARVRTSLTIDDVRFIRPDVAIISCTKRVHDERAESERAGTLPTVATFTAVASCEPDGWRVALAQTTPRLG